MKGQNGLGVNGEPFGAYVANLPVWLVQVGARKVAARVDVVPSCAKFARPGTVVRAYLRWGTPDEPHEWVGHVKLLEKWWPREA